MQAETANQVGRNAGLRHHMDLMHEQLEDDRPFRPLNVIVGLQQASAVDRGGLLVACEVGYPDVGLGQRMAWEAPFHSRQQRSGVHRRFRHRVGGLDGNTAGIHPARKAPAECVCRAVQPYGAL